MSNAIEHLTSLHTAAIDARNGYREAMKEAEGRGLMPLFTELASLHKVHATKPSSLLTERGQTPERRVIRDRGA